MYPIKLGFDEALRRIDALLTNGHSAEALVASIFTFEKLVRRSLRLAIVLRGFTSKQAQQLTDGKGFLELASLWVVFDREHRTLPELLGNDVWQHIPEASKMRNKFVHGQRVYGLGKCRDYANHVLAAVKKLHKHIRKDYGRDPWSVLPTRKKPMLNWIS